MVDTLLSLTKPSILLKGDDATFECDSTNANQFDDPGVTATDACGNALEPVVTTTAQPDTQRAGTYTVTYQAVNVFGNSSPSVTRTVTVKDTASPTITTCAADTTLTAGKGCQATLSDLRGNLVTQDACTASADLTITQEPAVGTVLDLGSYTVTFTVTDGTGQTATCTATVEVVSPDNNNNGQPDCLDDDSSGQAQPIVDSGCGSSACGASGAVSLMCTLLALAGLKRLPTRRMME
jgi:hypothetical protein